MKELLEESGARLDDLINSRAYRGASGWKFVVIVLGFVAAYTLGAAFGWDMHRLEGLAGLVIGHQFARTYRRAG